MFVQTVCKFQNTVLAMQRFAHSQPLIDVAHPEENKKLGEAGL